jgi:RNA polymerase sigma-70 factor (sigma-E family)
VDAQLADFVRAKYPKLLRRAYLLTGERGSAEDLVQEALARACAAGKRRRIHDLDGYVWTTMANLSIRRWRRSARIRELPTGALPDAGLSDHTDEEAERSRMWQALRELAPRQRAVLVLRYYEDLSEAQIAEVLNVRVGTVRSQTARGLNRIRAVLVAAREVESAS